MECDRNRPLGLILDDDGCVGGGGGGGDDDDDDGGEEFAIIITATTENKQGTKNGQGHNIHSKPYVYSNEHQPWCGSNLVDS
jgi:hypothetical protein